MYVPEIPRVVNGSATCGAQILAATDVPASGSYVDVSTARFVWILAKLGVVHGSDSPTLEPKCSDAVGGTADQISSTLVHTPATDDDQEWVSWLIETRKLPLDHHFLTMDVGGTTSNGTYAQITYFLYETELPVTQTEAVLPAASQYVWAG